MLARGRSTRTLLAAALAAALAAGCASAPPAPATPPGYREFRVTAVDEILFGTWTASPGAAAEPARLRILAWGLVEAFVSAQDAGPRWTGTSLVVDAWSDDEGARWYREYRRWNGAGPNGAGAFVLDWVAPDGLSLRTVSSAAGWPAVSDMGPAHPGFAEYMRVGAGP